MKYFSIFVLLLILACNSKHKAISNNNSFIFSNEDTIKYAILLYDSTYLMRVFDSKASTLSNSERTIVDSILVNEINIYNKIGIESYNSILQKDSAYSKTVSINVFIIEENFEDIYKQYLPMINLNGEKQVYINCMCHKFDRIDWKKHLCQVSDGGNCFFNALINLTQKKTIYLSVNGDA